jgi:sensor histidine kinase YesM
MKPFLILICLLFSPDSFSQNVDHIIDIADSANQIDIAKHVCYLRDINGNLTIDDVLNENNQARFIKSGDKILNFPNTTDWYWIKIEVQKKINSTQYLLEIAEAKIQFADLFFQDANEYWQVINNGYAIPIEKKYKRHYFQLFPLEFYKPHAIFYVHTKANLNPIPLKIFTSTEYTEQNTYRNLVYGLFAGLLLFIITNNISISIRTRNSLYILYASTVLGYTILSISSNGYLKMFTDINPLKAMDISVLIVFMFSSVYAKRFLNLTKNNGGKILDGYLVLSSIALITVVFFKSEQIFIHSLVQFFALMFQLIVISITIFSLRREGAFAKLYLSAYIIFAAFSILEVLHANTGKPSYLYLLHSEWGILSEVLILNYSLNRRSAFERKKLLTEKEKAQVDLLAQLKMKTEFEQQISRLELSSLRAQMRPDYISTSLDAINGFIIRNDRTAANNYISKFSSVVRFILEGAREHSVVLSKEIKFLDLYLHVEKLRRGENFNFKIDIDPDVDLSTEIPSMIVQPYIESFLWPAEVNAVPDLITITMCSAYPYIKCVIEDNGVDNQMPNEIRSRAFKINNASTRLATLNYAFKHNSFVEITDIISDNNKPSGTRIMLMLQCLK